MAFEVEVEEAVSRRHKGPSEEDLRKAPKWESASARPGSSEGQVCVFNKQGKLIAAQWSMASSAWIEMGEVVGSSGDQDSINGVPYDMVLPVELDTATGPLSMKLGDFSHFTLSCLIVMFLQDIIMERIRLLPPSGLLTRMVFSNRICKR